MPRVRKPTARLWPQARTPGTKYRDRGTAHLPDGTSKPVSGYGATKAAASAALDAKIEGLETQHLQAETITVTELFAEFFQHKRSVKGSKTLTQHADIGMFTRHIQPLIGEARLGELTLAQLQSVQHRLTSAGKWRSAELATVLLKSLLAYATKRYRPDVAAGRLTLVSKDDFDSIKRPQGAFRPAGELWTPEQVNAFLELARKRYLSQRTSTVYPLFYTALGAGLRRGELLGLGRKALKTGTAKGKPQSYLDITEQLVDFAGRLHHDTPKTESGVRRVPISGALAGVLCEHLERMDKLAKEQGRAPSPLMFPSSTGTPMTARTVYRARDVLIKDLGLPKSTLHMMRKAWCSSITKQLINAGTYSPKLVAKLLGHRSTDVALDVYTLVYDDDYNSAALELGVLEMLK